MCSNHANTDQVGCYCEIAVTFKLPSVAFLVFSTKLLFLHKSPMETSFHSGAREDKYIFLLEAIQKVRG